MRPYLTRDEREGLRVLVDRARRAQIAAAQAAKQAYWEQHPVEYQRRLARFRRANEARALKRRSC